MYKKSQKLKYYKQRKFKLVDEMKQLYNRIEETEIFRKNEDVEIEEYRKTIKNQYKKQLRYGKGDEEIIEKIMEDMRNKVEKEANKENG